MKRYALIVAVSTLALAGSAQGQACRETLQTLVIPQRGFAQIRSDLFAARPWLYLYVPDIKSRFGSSGFTAFDMWLVEGVYGQAFAQGMGAMAEPDFQKMRKSPNVKTQPIKVEYDEKAQSVARFSRAVTIGKDTVKIEVDQEKTSLLGTDTVTVRICR